MKVNVAAKVKNYDDKELPQTYREVFSTCLNSITEDEIVTAEKKAQLFQLTKKIYSANEIDLNVTERALIIERAGKVLKSPLAFGRIQELLDGK